MDQTPPISPLPLGKPGPQEQLLLTLNVGLKGWLHEAPRLSVLVVFICFCSLPPLRARQIDVLITAQKMRLHCGLRLLHLPLVNTASHHSTRAFAVPPLLSSWSAHYKLCMGKKPMCCSPSPLE